jgi:hypothetical protein
VSPKRPPHFLHALYMPSLSHRPLLRINYDVASFTLRLPYRRRKSCR